MLHTRGSWMDECGGGSGSGSGGRSSGAEWDG